MEDRGAPVVATEKTAAVVTPGMRTEDETGEEDHRDDEHHAGGDTDPGGGGAEPGAARFLAHRCDVMLGCGSDGGRRRFGWCFAHVRYFAGRFDEPVMRHL